MDMLATGNDEIKELPPLGKTVLCWVCGKKHRVQYGDTRMPDGTWEKSNLLAFFKCGETAYLCGIEGKEWRLKDGG